MQVQRLDPFRGDLGRMPDHFFDNTLGVECAGAPYAARRRLDLDI